MFNIAPRGNAFQSSISQWSHGEDEAKNALTGHAPDGYAFHTRREPNAWWALDLKKPCLISHINIYLRKNYANRNWNLKLEVSTDLSDWKPVDQIVLKEPDLLHANLKNELVRFVKIRVINQYLHLAKVEVFGDALINFRGCKIVEDPRLHPMVLSTLSKGHYEQTEIYHALKNTSSEDRILELGASIGGVSTVVIKERSPNTYTAIEANKDLIEIMERNHSLNDVKCNVINAAIDSTDGICDFYIHPVCWSSSLTPFDNPLRIDKVKKISFNNILNKTEANFLICDIEGGEYEIFTSAIDLKQVNKICIEMHPQTIEKMQNLYNYFIDHGFSCDEPQPSSLDNHVYYFYKDIIATTLQQ